MIKFIDLEQGQLFSCGDHLYLKMQDTFDVNAVNVSNGSAYNVDLQEEVVHYPEAKITL